MESLNEIRKRYTKSENVTDAIYHTLDVAIVDGTLQPGTRLLESELADAMEVSRTPVREALKRLMSDELISYSSHGNICVKEYSIPEICDVIQAIEGIRNITTYFAAESIDRIFLARLSTVLDSIDQLPAEHRSREDEGEVRYLYDEVFHEIICESTGNEILMSFYTKLMKKFHIIQNTSEFKSLRLAFSEVADQERKQIYEALCKKDPNKALALAVKHSQHSFNRMKSLVSGI